jgi:radical SAM superfamily enzyme YgiQ (UPF0313 family)
MNILIVETVWMGKEKYKFFDITLLTAFTILPTLHARQLAAITPKNHTVTVINERYSRLHFDLYDLVVIDYVTATAPRAYEIADTFRKKGVPVVLSGMHASALPEEAKLHADSVLIGRAEVQWLTVLQDVEKKSLQPFYTSQPYDETICLPPTEIQLPRFVMTGAIEATRGCPYRCAFCPETTFSKGAGFYKRPVDEVIAEIKVLPQRIFTFYDTSLTIDPDYTKTLFKKMKGLHKRFLCNGNADVLASDVELVRLSKEAGCICWLIGFESISQRTIKSVGKKTNIVNQYITAIRNIHAHRMAVIGCFMFGFDTDMPTVFHETLESIKEFEIDVPDFCVLTPFPGTPVFQQFEAEGRILTKDWTRYNLKHVVFQPKQMSPDQLHQGVQKLYMELYTPLSSLRRIMKSLRFGLYPFFAVFARNIVAMMNSRRLFTKEETGGKS